MATNCSLENLDDWIGANVSSKKVAQGSAMIYEVYEKVGGVRRWRYYVHAMKRESAVTFEIHEVESRNVRGYGIVRRHIVIMGGTCIVEVTQCRCPMHTTRWGGTCEVENTSWLMENDLWRNAYGLASCLVTRYWTHFHKQTAQVRLDISCYLLPQWPDRSPKIPGEVWRQDAKSQRGWILRWPGYWGLSAKAWQMRKDDLGRLIFRRTDVYIYTYNNEHTAWGFSPTEDHEASQLNETSMLRFRQI